MADVNDDNELVPAFDASLGLPMGDGEPDKVPKKALDKLNNQIRDEHLDVLRYHNEAAQVASLFAKRAIRPDEIAALRRQMFDVVKKGLVEVEQVVMGQKTWSPTQTRLFAILTERVMPKLSNITVEDNTAKKLEDLSLDELEAIALGKKKAGAVDAVVKRAEVYDEQAEKVERREAKRDVVRQLSYIDALDKAEKDYIARIIDRPASEIADDQMRKAMKPQPKHTPEQLARVRQARKKTMEDYWREQGYTDEEIVAKKEEVMRKRLLTKAQLRAEKMERLAVKQGLDDDAMEVARKLRNERLRTLREFRVPPAKGVRSSTKLARDAIKRAEAEAKRADRELRPRIYGAFPIEGVSEEQRKTLTLDKLRELRPDLFAPSKRILPEDES